AALDVVLPRRRHGADASIAEVIGARFGREVVDNLVEPLLGGINAGRADRLSLAATAPQLADAARDHRSLLLGLRVATAGGPVFQSVRGGLERLVERLGADIDVRTSTAAGAIERAPDGRWKVAGLVADAVVVTVPAFAAAPLLQAVSPVAAAGGRARRPPAPRGGGGSRGGEGARHDARRPLGARLPAVRARTPGARRSHRGGSRGPARAHRRRRRVPGPRAGGMRAAGGRGGGSHRGVQRLRRRTAGRRGHHRPAAGRWDAWLRSRK